MPRLPRLTEEQKNLRHREENAVSNKRQITSRHTKRLPNLGLGKLLKHLFFSGGDLQSRAARESEKRGQVKGCPTPHAWVMSLIQNAPSLADVKSRKMAHYCDRKAKKKQPAPVGLERNYKGRDRGRWHLNIFIFQLFLG